MKLVKRFKEIDSFKGVLIFFVILGHSDFEFARYIYWFHMPAFFIVSGFLFNPSKIVGNLSSFLKKKTLSLLVPYAIFLILFSVIGLIVFHNAAFSIKFLVKLVFGGKLLVNEFGVFWFITSLLFTVFFFTFLYIRIKNKTLLFLCVMICFFIAHLESFLIHNKNYSIYVPLNLDTSLMGVVYFYYGFLFKSYYNNFKEKVNQNRLISIGILTLWLIGIFFFVDDFSLDMKYQNYGNIIFSLILPISITLALFTIVVALPKIGVVQNSLILMGRYSLLIMYLHLFIKYILLAFGVYSLSLFVLLSIILPIALSKMFERNRYTAFLFLGDTNKFNFKL